MSSMERKNPHLPPHNRQMGTYENPAIKVGAHQGLIKNVRVAVMKRRFLTVFAITGHVYRTCQILGMNYKSPYYWKKNDAQFLEDYNTASEIALMIAEDEAFRRGVYGVDKPVFYKGMQVGAVREYSDYLLDRILRARAPEKYRDTWKGELTGPNGTPLQPATINHVHSNIPIANSEEEIDYNKQLINKNSIFDELPIIPEAEVPSSLPVNPPGANDELEDLLGPEPAPPGSEESQSYLNPDI